MAFIDTPRTDAGGNLTFLDTRANAIDDMSMEASFMEPKKSEHDLIEQMRKKRNPSTSNPVGNPPLRTPSARAALNELSSRKLLPARRAGEFTPLMQSVTKRNASKAVVLQTPDPSAKSTYGPGDAMPQFLKEDLDRNFTPLTKPDFSFISHNSSIGPSERSIVAPLDSSGYSTPMHFPGRGEGILGNGRNIMNLKEQERVVDKIEKENFGLKLKIHFLEQKLAERDPNFNENALRENSQLKMDRVVMQKELQKIKKQLAKAEKEADALRRELKDAQASAEREEEMQRLEDECNHMQATIDRKQAEIDGKDVELENLRDQLQDMQEPEDRSAVLERKEEEVAALRDQVDELKEQVDDLKEQLEDALNNKERSDELERKISEIEDLKEQLEELQASDERDVQLARKDAEIERLEEAIEDLRSSDENDDKLARKDAEIERLQEMIEDLQASDERDNLLFQKEAEIERLQEQIEDLQMSDQRDADLRQKEADNDDLRRQINELQTAMDSDDRSTLLTNLRTAHDQQGTELVRKDIELKQLREDLRSAQALAAARDDHAELQRLQASLRRKDGELDDKDAELERLRSQMSDMQASSRSHNDDASQLRKLQSSYYEKEAALDRKDSNLRNLARQMEELRESTKAKNYSPRIKRLQADSDDKDVQLRQRNDEIDQLNQQLKYSSTTSNLRRNELRDLEDSCKTKDEEIKRLMEVCNTKDRRISSVLNEYDNFAKDKGKEIDALRNNNNGGNTKQHSPSSRDFSAQVTSLERALTAKDQDLEAVLKELQSKEMEWDRERARVRFVNTSMSSDVQNEKMDQLERKHDEKYQQLKVKYRDDTAFLAREIKWLRAKADREAAFKAALIHEKTYLTVKSNLYQTFNEIDLELLGEMNCRVNPEVARIKPARKLAAAAQAVLFTVRVRRVAAAWSKQQELRPLRNLATSSGGHKPHKEQLPRISAIGQSSLSSRRFSQSGLRRKT